MNACDLSNAAPADLATLLQVVSDSAGQSATLWQENDYAAIFQHLLSSPLLLVTGPADDQDSRDEQATFGTMKTALFAKVPDLQVLALIKRFAKQAFQSNDGQLPEPVALALYYLVICVAMIQTDNAITELTHSQLVEGIDWSLQQTWLDEQTRSVFLAAQASLRA